MTTDPIDIGAYCPEIDHCIVVLEISYNALIRRYMMAKRLIIGGAFQGKVRYFEEHYQPDRREVIDFSGDEIIVQGKVILSCISLSAMGENIVSEDSGEGSATDRGRTVEDILTAIRLSGAKHFYACQELVRWVTEQGSSVECLWKTLFEPLSSWSVIMNEVGNGIIPMEAEKRRYREAVGQFGCLAAASADEVVRVFCGLGTKIK